MHGISHSWAEETPEAKARWFQTLTLEERMDYLVEMTELILQNNPSIVDQRDAPATQGRIRVLEQARR